MLENRDKIMITRTEYELAWSALCSAGADPELVAETAGAVRVLADETRTKLAPRAIAPWGARMLVDNRAMFSFTIEERRALCSMLGKTMHMRPAVTLPDAQNLQNKLVPVPKVVVDGQADG